MPRPLDDKRILVFVEEDYEDLELWYPKLRLEEAGAHVTVAGPIEGETYVGKHGYPCVSDAEIEDMEESDFHAVVCPGGWAPDKLRRDPKVLELVGAFHAKRKLIAAICHGGWIPISAGVYDGVRVTGSPGIKDDLLHAGADFVDESVVVDGHHVTSRRPGDLPDFLRGMLSVLG
jgi:protease I